ncbi:uncharacterized protein A4U43_C05F21920 [Asparagus officinalis]|uniref:RRM domain-containing protein n=1 Tax=Asparagus officinalis TaxID=4686 RepID=A0A5P1ETH6_ASPOF|nr:uncharacterized protein A4U43_C05F21920 [Asparagus officinalis]
MISYADPSVVDKVIEGTHIFNNKQIIPDFLLKVWKVAGPFDHHTNQSRGFGFVVFNSEQAVGDLLRKGNMIHMSGSQDEIKRNIPKGSVQSDYFKTKKIFCLWNSTYMTDDEYQSFFSKHGKVLDHAIIRDPSTSQSRDFGFIGFDSIQIVDDLLAKGNMIDMAGSQIIGPMVFTVGTVVSLVVTEERHLLVTLVAMGHIMEVSMVGMALLRALIVMVFLALVVVMKLVPVKFMVEIKKERLHEIKGFQNKEDFCCGIPLTMTEDDNIIDLAGSQVEIGKAEPMKALKPGAFVFSSES